jgi:NAD+ kinase
VTLTIGVALKHNDPTALRGLSSLRDELPDASLLIERDSYNDLEVVPEHVERVDAAAFEERSDLVVVFGGDGTLIHAASLLPNRAVPILGVNLGRIGFLTEVTMDELREALHMAIAGKLPHSDRVRLDVTIERAGEVVLRRRILNEVVLNRHATAPIATYRVAMDDKLVTNIRGDGVIISTPTGSTAYSMAAGGSILAPALEAIAITPVSPYQLTQRPLVIKPAGELRLSLVSDGPVYATCDGQAGRAFDEQDIARVTRAPIPTRILTVPWRDYYEMLRAKLRWGA